MGVVQAGFLPNGSGSVALYRRLFLEMLIAAHKADRLQFFNGHAALADFKTFAADASVHEPIFIVVCRPRWSMRPDRLSRLDRALPSRSSTSIDDGVCGARIPIAPAARSPSPSRDFLPWPVAYAGCRCMPRRRHGRHPQTFTSATVNAPPPERRWLQIAA